MWRPHTLALLLVLAPLVAPAHHASQTTAAALPYTRLPYTHQYALAARGLTREGAYLRAAPAFAAARLALLPAGTALAVDGWATDAGGAAWYHTASTSAGASASVVGAVSGWVYGDAVTLDRGIPARATLAVAPFTGKGMWATYGLLQRASAAAIVSAARAAGLSHLYVEVGRANRGFYGGPGLATLLPAAHAAGLKVIAWIYPFLRDLPFDIATGVAAATYTTPSGDRPDGLLADVEENTGEGAVRAYGAILRATLGPDEPMAIATFPPQWSGGRAYPFATAALSWDAIVPMDYWRLRRRPYSAAEVYRFVRDSVTLIKARTRPDEPVEVLGQMFDLYRTGANSPGAAEIAACAAAARDSGAIGVSFFEWSHATSAEWNALTALTAPPAVP